MQAPCHPRTEISTLATSRIVESSKNGQLAQPSQLLILRLFEYSCFRVTEVSGRTHDSAWFAELCSKHNIAWYLKTEESEQDIFCPMVFNINFRKLVIDFEGYSDYLKNLISPPKYLIPQSDN
ncbi:hypothetical protein M0802_004641 [Mischocyttarus mexicanus]|nr:hypothetical protein M0802_004641 [Mischocyttarus mexicanus]